MRLLRLVALVVLAGVAAVLFTPHAASAHAGSSNTASNFRTTLLHVEPAMAGVTVSIAPASDQMQLENRSPLDVVVEGYESEPYLRIGPSGAYVNKVSPAYYLNQTQDGSSVAPSDADAKKPPEWKKLSSTPKATWHDHRIHWMVKTNPLIVQQQPDRVHTIIERWLVPMRFGDADIAVTGRLDWVPGPSPLPWYVLSAVAALVGALGTMWRARREALVIAMLSMSVVAAAVVETGSALGVAGSLSVRLSQGFEALLPVLVAGAIGLVGVVRLHRRLEDGAWFALFAAAVIFLLSGLGNVDVLLRSQLPYGFSDGTARVGVALSLGGSGGVVLTTAWMVWQQRKVRVARMVVSP